MATLVEAHQAHPSARWWVKADGCDIVSGLEESLRNEWNGDVDLGTGDLQKMYHNYLGRLKRIQSLATLRAQDALDVVLQEKTDLTDDLNSILEGMLKIAVTHSNNES